MSGPLLHPEPVTPVPAAERPHRGWHTLEKEIADEWGRQHAQQACPGRYCARRCSPVCRNVCFSRTTTHMAYVLLLVCLLVSVVVLLFTDVAIVDHQLQLKHFVHTSCTVTDTEYLTNLTVSTAPCLRVHVTYTPGYGATQVHTMLQDTQLNQLCTYHKGKDINKYLNTYGHGYAIFPCFYNPRVNSTQVVMETNPPIGSEIAWPLVILCGCIMGLMSVCFICGCKYMCLKDAPRIIQHTASVLQHQHGIYSLKKLPVFERQRVLRECTIEFDSNEDDSAFNLIRGT